MYEHKNDTRFINLNTRMFAVGDNFRQMLYNNILEWEQFQKMDENIKQLELIEYITKLLYLENSNNLKEFLIPILVKIYKLSDEHHLYCMIKQYKITTAMNVTIHALFTTIRLYYESIVLIYLHERNKYIKDKSNDKPVDKPIDKKNKINVISELKQLWNDLNTIHKLETSSIILYFLNPVNKDLENNLYLDISTDDKKLNKLSKNLLNSVKKFHYRGFCPKVAADRLKFLLEFPVDDFISIISYLNPEIKFTDNDKLVKILSKKLTIEKPKLHKSYKRKKIPTDILESGDTQKIAKWYVDEIFNIRKSLLQTGIKYEEYYIKKAQIYDEINTLFKNEFDNIIKHSYLKIE